MSCQQCGQCCHRFGITLTIEDMNREPRLWDYALPIHKVGNPKLRHYMATHDMPWAIKSGKGQPCPFLANNQCLIYKGRPQICRDYPGDAQCILENQQCLQCA